MSDEEGDYTSPVKIAFPTTSSNKPKAVVPVNIPLISLENGLNEHHDMPPLPAGSPPKEQNSSDLGNFQNFMKVGLLSLGKDIADSFAHSIAGLDSSIRGGFDILRERLDDDMCYVDGEEGEIQEGDDNEYDDNEHIDTANVKQPVQTPVIVPLAALAATIVKDDGRGPKVNPSLSNHVQSLMRIKPEEEVIKKVFDSIKQPEGCEGLSQVSVNLSIWEKMNNEAKGQDVKLQKIQLAIVKGTTEVVRMYDELLKLLNDGVETEKVTKILDIGNNALICMGVANVELVQRRREAIRPGFETSYAHLFNQNMPFTEALFGDDLTKNIKDITEDNKLLNNVVKSQRGGARGRFISRGARGRSSSSFHRPAYNASYNNNSASRNTSYKGRQSFSQERNYKRPYQTREPQNYKRGRQRRN